MRTNKNMLKHAVAVILMTGTFCGGAGAADGTLFDFTADFHGLSPRRGMDWKSAAGVEVQARFWQTANLGIALAAGSESWKAKTVVEEYETASTYTYSSVMGDATVTTLGASLCFRSEPVAEVKFTMDMGLRYALIDSSVMGEAAYDGPGGPSYLNEKIKIDNTLLFVIGAGVEFEMTRNVALILGIGYQVDLKKPQETFAGESLGETSLDAVSYKIGFAGRF